MSAKGFRMASASIELSQENDCCDSGKDGQTMKVLFENGGGGIFYRLHTKAFAMNEGDFVRLAKVCSEVRDTLNKWEGK